jgi:hypothetical protein
MENGKKLSLRDFMINKIKKTFDIKKVTLEYFCNAEICFGDALFKIDSEWPEVAPIKYAPAGATLVGISLINVIEIDLSKYNIPRDTTTIGSRVQILERGNIIISLPPLEIPYGQPLYINQDGQITWKYSIYRIGKAISDQDKDGYIKALINV